MILRYVGMTLCLGLIAQLTCADSSFYDSHVVFDLGSQTWGVYGFHDGFNQTSDWYDEFYMGLNQAQTVVGIENHRSGLCWKHFMANPEIRPMLDAIGFVPDESDPATDQKE